jgi:hypothetical protein
MNTGKAKAPDDALDLVTVWMLVANFGLARKRDQFNFLVELIILMHKF